MSIVFYKKIKKDKLSEEQNIIYYIYNVLCTDKYINIIAVIRGNGYHTLSECTLEQQKQIQHHNTHDIEDISHTITERYLSALRACYANAKSLKSDIFGGMLKGHKSAPFKHTPTE